MLLLLMNPSATKKSSFFVDFSFTSFFALIAAALFLTCTSVRAGERAEGLQPATFLQDLHDGQAATEHWRAEGHDGVLHWPHHQDWGDVAGAGNSALCCNHTWQESWFTLPGTQQCVFCFFPEKYSEDSVWRCHHQQCCLSGECLQVQWNWCSHNSNNIIIQTMHNCTFLKK